MTKKDVNIEKLADDLYDLAGQWRFYHSSNNLEKAAGIIEKYLETIESLWNQGWRGDGLLPTGELPDKYMPKYFLSYWQRKN